MQDHERPQTQRGSVSPAGAGLSRGARRSRLGPLGTRRASLATPEAAQAGGGQLRGGAPAGVPARPPRGGSRWRPRARRAEGGEWEGPSRGRS